MNASQVIMDALVRNRFPSCGMDGGTGWEGFVDMEAHDRQYHHGHYDGGRCKLRESIGQATGLLSQIGISLPDHSSMRRTLADARSNGLLDDQTADELSSIEGGLRSRLNDLDSGNVDMEELGRLAQELNTVYKAIHDAMAAREDEHDPEPHQEESEAPAEALHWTDRNELPIRRAGYDFNLPQRKIDTDGYELPPLTWLTFDDISGEYLTALGNMVPDSLREEARSSASILSPDMGVAMRDILLSPGKHLRFVNKVRDMDDCPFKERFLKTLDVVCDKLDEARRKSEERARTAFELLDRIADNPSVEITEEQIDLLDDMIKAHFGLRVAEEMIGALTDPDDDVTTGAANLLLNYVESLGDTGRLVSAVLKAHNAVHPDRKILTEKELALYSPPCPPDVMAQDEATAAEYGISRTHDGRPAYNGDCGESNCWVNDNCMNMGFRGFDVTPVLDGGAYLRWFGDCKIAMSKVYQKINGDSREDTRRWLEEHDGEIPDGSTISTWSGGHNIGYHKVGGRWYLYDGYFEEYGEMTSLRSIANCCWAYPEDSEIGTGSEYINDSNIDSATRMFKLLAKREIASERRSAGLPTNDIPEEEIDRRSRKLYHDSHSSFLILPTQPLVPQMFRSARESPRCYKVERE